MLGWPCWRGSHALASSSSSDAACPWNHDLFDSIGQSFSSHAGARVSLVVLRSCLLGIPRFASPLFASAKNHQTTFIVIFRVFLVSRTTAFAIPHILFRLPESSRPKWPSVFTVLPNKFTMPNKEAVVLILDANPSMTAEVATAPDEAKIDNNNINPLVSPSASTKTRFDCAKEVCIAIISDLMFRSKTNEVTVLVLHTETTNNFHYEEKDSSESNNVDDEVESDSSSTEKTPSHRQFPNLTEISGDGEVMGIRQPLPNLLRKIHQLKPTPENSNQSFEWSGGDFESGLIYAADALHRRTAGKKFDRRIILLTDAEHRLNQDKETDLLLRISLDKLRAMDCCIQVVGMGFIQTFDSDTSASDSPGIKDEQINDRNDASSDGDSVSESDSGDDSDSGCESNEDCDDVDGLEIKRENEEYLSRLSKKMGGFVYSFKELKGALQRLSGPNVAQSPSKRKLILEIAPNILLHDARYYKLISKTASIPLKKKLVMTNQDSDQEIHDESKKNALGIEMLQDYETTTTHWNAEDENEELYPGRITQAYRFGSDLLPFSSLDELGLMQRSPVKLTILGYVPESSIPHYLRIDSPYVLSGNESRRCCAAISALAIGLKETKKAAIGIFVKVCT